MVHTRAAFYKTYASIPQDHYERLHKSRRSSDADARKEYLGAEGVVVDPRKVTVVFRFVVYRVLDCMTGVNNFSHDHLTKLFTFVCFSLATRKGIGIFW